MKINADITKLHNEVNQYINHKFVIVTTAITITGVVLGWITKDIPAPPDPKMFFLALSLLIVLVFLYVTSQVINRSISVITSYLRAKKLSNWEIEYSGFMKKNKIKWTGQGESLRIVFGILGFLAGFIPFVLTWLTNTSCTPLSLVSAFVFGGSGVTQATICGSGVTQATMLGALGATLLCVTTLLYEIYMVFGTTVVITSALIGLIILFIAGLKGLIPLPPEAMLFTEVTLCIVAIFWIFWIFWRERDFDMNLEEKWENYIISCS